MCCAFVCSNGLLSSTVASTVCVTMMGEEEEDGVDKVSLTEYTAPTMRTKKNNNKTKKTHTHTHTHARQVNCNMHKCTNTHAHTHTRTRTHTHKQ